jgi:Clp amino terminal domain, pathogenicity island component
LARHLLKPKICCLECFGNRALLPQLDYEQLRAQIAKRRPAGQPTPTSIDLPLSDECKRVLAYAAEEASALNHRYIGTEHLLLGVMREPHTAAAQILSDHGCHPAMLREHMARAGEPQGASSMVVSPPELHIVHVDTRQTLGHLPIFPHAIPREGDVLMIEQEFIVERVLYQFDREPFRLASVQVIVKPVSPHRVS